MSEHIKAVLIVVLSGLIWSFGPLVVKNMIDPQIYQLPYLIISCLLYTSPSPRDLVLSRMPSSA